MVEIEERCLGTFQQHLLTASQRTVKQRHRVGDVGLQATAVLDEATDDLVDVERLFAGLFDHEVLGDRTSSHRVGEVFDVDHLTDAHADPARLVGVRRPDALQRGADLVVATHRLGDRIVGLMPRKDQMRQAGNSEPFAQDAAPLECVDLVEQRRQINHDTIGDHGHDMVIQHATRDQLQSIFLVIDHHRVTGVVAALVTHHIGVFLRQ